MAIHFLNFYFMWLKDLAVSDFLMISRITDKILYIKKTYKTNHYKNQIGKEVKNHFSEEVRKGGK